MKGLALLWVLCFTAWRGIAADAVAECNCDFEDGWCCWQNDPDNGEDWDLGTGESERLTHSGPPADHTTGTQDGYYSFVGQLSQLLPDNTARLVSSNTFDKDLCLTFWYHMYGSQLGTFEVIIERDGVSNSIFKREGGLSVEWLSAQLRTEETRDYRVVFEVVGGVTNVGTIAIDDIMFYEGECPPRKTCGFESADMCGYTNHPENDFDWEDIQAIDHKQGPGYDVTTGSPSGYYMYIESDAAEGLQLGRLISPEYRHTYNSLSCLRFWYHMQGDDGSTLNVYQAPSNSTTGNLTKIYSTMYDQGAFWHVAAVQYRSYGNHRIVFEGTTHESGMDFDVSLDEVLIKEGHCSGAQATCNFEVDQCTWMNLRHGEDDFDWLRYTGASSALSDLTGPQKDHTTDSENGWYMYLESAPPGDRYDIGRMVSDVFMPGEDRCFQLWNFMFGAFEAPGTIRVLAEFTDGSGDVLLWSKTGNQGDQWFEGLAQMPTNMAFRVAIEGELDKLGAGDLAVDDTFMHDGLCSDKPGEEDFVCHDDSTRELDASLRCNWVLDCEDGSDEVYCGECTFDVDYCRYDEISRSDYEWVRASGATITPGTGPSGDATSGDGTGYYMLTEAHTGSVFSGSTMRSPTVRESSSTCMLYFYYHMYGDHIGKLDVWINQNGGLKTRIWMARGSAGDEWHIASTVIGRVTTDWWLTFQTTPLFNEEGDIAVDGIIVSDCAFPVAESTCSGEKFWCDNGACIKDSNQCDFTDDCGDRSDEDGCDDLGYHGCNFEHGWCGYTNSEENVNAEWWEHQGLASEIGGETGPARDHTTNSATGYYLYVDTRFPVRSGDRARLLTVNFEPGTCELRFYFHLWGDHVGRFTVYTRTEINGQMKTLFSAENDHGDFWIKQVVQLDETEVFQVVFELIVGSGLWGDVALDDVVVTPECPVSNDDLPVVEPQPATPSPCATGMFVCGDGTCIDEELKCNYKVDCPDGSDETVCGECDFEVDQCGWSDASSGAYRWKRYHITDNTASHAPATDGAGRTDGHYMMIVGDLSLFYFAGIMVTDAGIMGQSCKVSFKYHISGNDVGATALQMQNPDRSLHVYMLWFKRNDQGTDWKRAEVYMGEHEDFRLDFESYPIAGTFTGDAGDICVDEIVYIDCHPDDNKPYVSDLTCDFEIDMCGWQQEPNDIDVDDFDWKRRSGTGPTISTGPEHDNTKYPGSDDGTYLVAESTVPMTEKRAVFVTYPQPATTEMCLTFYYHMYGATVGSLTLRQRQLGFAAFDVFRKEGTLGNEWHKMQKTLGLDDVQFQFEFIADMGNGVSSDIAVDDIEWTEGECPPSLWCDFEGREWCDWTNDETNDFNWRRGRDGTMSDNTGPTVDHTTGTEDGWYLFIETSWPRREGWEARLLSAVIPGGTTECLEFWYHMSGDDIGSLYVYTRTVDTGGESETVWEKHTDQGNQWRYGVYEAYAPFDYQIVIEGVRGGDTKGDIAIDDLYPKVGSCGIPGHCTFDGGNMCGWTNNRDADDFDWQRDKDGTPTSGTGPPRDHTTASAAGYYMYTESSSPVTQGWKAWLTSEHFDPTPDGCFIFYYHMHGSDMGMLRVYYAHAEQLGSRTEIWSKKGDQGDDWKEVRISINLDYEFQILIEGIRGNGQKSNMAIDDTEMFYGNCDDYVPPNYPEYSSTNTGAIVFTCIILTLLIIGCLSGVWYYYRKKQNKSMVPESLSNTLSSISAVSFKKSTPASTGFDSSIDNPGYGMPSQDHGAAPVTLPSTTKDTATLYDKGSSA